MFMDSEFRPNQAYSRVEFTVKDGIDGRLTSASPRGIGRQRRRTSTSTSRLENHPGVVLTAASTAATDATRKHFLALPPSPPPSSGPAGSPNETTSHRTAVRGHRPPVRRSTGASQSRPRVRVSWCLTVNGRYAAGSKNLPHAPRVRVQMVGDDEAEIGARAVQCGFEGGGLESAGRRRCPRRSRPSCGAAMSRRTDVPACGCCGTPRTTPASPTACPPTGWPPCSPERAASPRRSLATARRPGRALPRPPDRRRLGSRRGHQTSRLLAAQRGGL